jgi:uncharacterized repeat protein (TIGR03803 family)
LKFKFSSPTSFFVAICLFSLISLESQPAHAQQATETILYGGFSSATGEYPYDYGSLVMDASGNLYGTTYEGGAGGYGTVFELVNSSGTYSEKVLYSFTGSGGDGSHPYAGLIMDASGNLYSTTETGGTSGYGTVFELVNSSGSYSEKVLYSFTGSGGDGSDPLAGLIMDASGNLYSTTFDGGTSGCGTVFELVNSSSTYSEKVLHSFANSGGDGWRPYAGLIMDASGNLYGTTYVGGTSGPGTVFELVNSSGTYSEKVLYSFTGSGGDGSQPVAGLIMDASGNLYGTTLIGGTSEDCYGGCGTVFELVNSSGTYSEKVLHSFTYSDGEYPQAGLIMDASGNLYGTTEEGGTSGGNGTVFELVNSSGAYSEKVLYSFTDSSWDGFYVTAGLIMDASGNLYGTTGEGDASGYGTVFEVTNATALSVSSNPSPSNYGQSVTFTATISDAFGNAKKRSKRTAGRPQVVTGTVTWSANTGCGTTSVTSGTATCTTSILPVGDDTVTANYSGNRNPASGSISQTVNQAATTINVTSVSPSSEQYGQDAPVTITAVLSWTGNGTAPTATNVTIGGNGNGTYGATSCGSPSGDTMTCTATYTPSTNDAVGTYTETSTFSGDSNYTGSNSTQSGNFSITQAGSGTITVGSSQNPSAHGQSLTFTATIPGQYGAIRRNGKVRSQVVTGTVQWSSNTGCGTTQVTSGTPGTATCTTNSLPIGSDTVSANYSGDGNHSPGSGSVSQTVNQAATTINVISVNPSSEDYGSTALVTISATLSWSGSGTAPTAADVTIRGSGLSGSFGTTSCGAPSGDTISCSNTYTPSGNDVPGSYTMSASFSGDTNYSASSSAQTNNFTINSASSTTSVSSSMNPSNYGQSVTFTATINGENGNVKGRRSRKGVKSQVVTGTVTWSSNTGCGTTTMTTGNPGTAMCTTTSLPGGTDTIAATYSGDSNHSGSTGTLSGGQVVQSQPRTLINVTSVIPASESYGQNQPITITAVLSWTGSGVAPTASDVAISGNGPSGTYGATSCGASSGNTITCTNTYTPTVADTVGSYTESATFAGDSNYSSSSSPQTNNFAITQASSSTSVTSGTNPSTYGQPVTFTATISGEYGLVKGRNGALLGRALIKNGAKSQDVSGSVQWSANTGCGTTTVTTGNPGTATCTTTSLPGGTDTVTATYSGDSNHTGSTGTLSGGQVVNPTTQTITFTMNAPAKAVYGTSFTVAASAISGLPITYSSGGSCSNMGATYTMTSGTGTCTVTASQPGNNDYQAASPVSESTAAERANQTVTFTGAPATAPYSSTFVMTATTDASTVAYITTSNLTTCSLSGPYSPVTVTMLKDTGKCTFTASWGADQNYNPATATQTTTAEKATPVMSWATPAPIIYGTPLSATQLDATANVAGSFTYSPAAGKIEAAGNDTLTVTFKPTSADYTTTTASVTLEVLPTATVTTITSPSQTITLSKVGVATSTLDFNVTSYEPTGSVTLTATTGETCSGALTPTGGDGKCKLTFNTSGVRTITATYGGDSNHNGSNSSGQNPAVTVTVKPY